MKGCVTGGRGRGSGNGGIDDTDIAQSESW